MALWDVTLCRRIRFHSVRGRAVSLESKVSDPGSGAGGALRMGDRRTVSDVDDVIDLGCDGIYRGTAVAVLFCFGMDPHDLRGFGMDSHDLRGFGMDPHGLRSLVISSISAKYTESSNLTPGFMLKTMELCSLHSFCWNFTRNMV